MMRQRLGAIMCSRGTRVDIGAAGILNSDCSDFIPRVIDVVESYIHVQCTH